MTRRRDIEKHRHSLGEIRDIMNAMKNLSYIETRKISGFLDVQHEMVRHIESVASDFLSFYPDTLTETTEAPVDVFLLIGSERGFCGDFNHALINFFDDSQLVKDSKNISLIVVGQKLEALMENDERSITFIDGASVVEEVNDVLNQIVDQLLSIHELYGVLNLYVLYHDYTNQIVSQHVLPPFQDLLSHRSEESHAPDLHLSPEQFFLDLSYHYLFIVLYEIFFTSLMTESHQRVAHLDGAVQRMDEQSEELLRQSNIMRQEEIIEEIEVILLNTVSLDESSLQI